MKDVVPHHMHQKGIWASVNMTNGLKCFTVHMNIEEWLTDLTFLFTLKENTALCHQVCKDSGSLCWLKMMTGCLTSAVINVCVL